MFWCQRAGLGDEVSVVLGKLCSEGSQESVGWQDPGKLAEGCTVSFHLLSRIFEDFAGYFSGLKQITRMEMHTTIQT